MASFEEKSKINGFRAARRSIDTPSQLLSRAVNADRGRFGSQIMYTVYVAVGGGFTLVQLAAAARTGGNDDE